MKVLFLLLIHVTLIYCLGGCIYFNQSRVRPGDLNIEMASIDGPSEVFEQSRAEFSCLGYEPEIPSGMSTDPESAEYMHLEFCYHWSCDPSDAGRFENPDSLLATFEVGDVEQDTPVQITFEVWSSMHKKCSVSTQLTIRNLTTEEWTRTWGQSEASDIAVDLQGNSYIVGIFYRDTDFAPGAEEDIISHLPCDSCLGDEDYPDFFLTRLSPSGERIWTKTWGFVALRNEVPKVAVDFSGNIFVTGLFEGSPDFDPGPETTVISTAPNNPGTFLSCFDADGNFRWVRNWGIQDAGILSIKDMKSGADGSLWLTGAYTGTVDLDPQGGISLAHAEGFSAQEIFLLKLTPAGSLEWARTWGNEVSYRFMSGSGEACKAGINVALDSLNNCYVAGEYAHESDMDPGQSTDIRSTTGSYRDLFLSKFDSSGNYQWCQSWGGAQDDYITGLGVDSEGNPFVSGHFYSAVDFDPGPDVKEIQPATHEVTYSTCEGDRFNETMIGSIFLSKFDTGGNFQWVRNWAVPGHSPMHMGERRPPVYGALAVGPMDRIVLSDSFSEEIDLDPGDGEFLGTWSGGPGLGLFSIVLNLNGEYVSSEIWGSRISMANAIDAAFDLSGYVFTLSNVSVCPEVRKKPLGTTPVQTPVQIPDESLTSTAPIEQGGITQTAAYAGSPSINTGWVATFGGRSHDRASGIAVDSENNIYLAGSYGMTVDFDPGPDSEERITEGYDIFLLELSPDSSLQWVYTWGGKECYGTGLEINTSGDLILTGSFGEAMDIDPGPVVHTIEPNNPYSDGFICELTPSGILNWVASGITVGDMVIDPDNNTWVKGSKHDERGAGWFWLWKLDPEGNVLFDERDHYDYNNRILFEVSGMDPSQDYYWFNLCGGAVVDSDGNIYLADCFTKSTNFNPLGDAVEQAPVGESEIYLAKWDSSGQLIWLKTWGSTEDWPRQSGVVALSPDGSLYVYGYFEAPCDFDPGPDEFVLPATGYVRSYISRFTPDGEFVWAHAWGGGDQFAENYIENVTFDSLGNIYLCGSFSGTTDFCPGNPIYEVTSNGSTDAYILKIRPDGTW